MQIIFAKKKKKKNWLFKLFHTDVCVKIREGAQTKKKKTRKHSCAKGMDETEYWVNSFLLLFTFLFPRFLWL